MIEYTSNKVQQQYSSDTKGIESNCNSIAFTNQGAATVNIFSGRGSAYRVLDSGKSFSYSNDPNVKKVTEFDIVFVGAGVKDLLVEREFITPVC